MSEVTAETAAATAADKDFAEEQKKFEEITIKFGKGCVGDQFTAKDGKEYKEILVPNKDENDHRPWATFVARANAVHEDKFGKGMWIKVPADGHTTIRRQTRIGTDEQGKGIWKTDKKRIPNRELKSMCEFYKERSSLKEKMGEKKAELAAMAAKAPAVQTPSRAQAAEI